MINNGIVVVALVIEYFNEKRRERRLFPKLITLERRDRLTAEADLHGAFGVP